MLDPATLKDQACQLSQANPGTPVGQLAEMIAQICDCLAQVRKESREAFEEARRARHLGRH